MFKLKQVDYLVVHCAATRPSADIGVKEITGWHKERGFTTIGYHKVIRRDGTVENGRDEQYAGAHVKGYNSKSLGVSLVGGVREDDPSVAEANFTPAQYMALANLLHDWMAKYPSAIILGHRDLSPDTNADGVLTPDEWLKECPSFDVHKWVRDCFYNGAHDMYAHGNC